MRSPTKRWIARSAIGLVVFALVALLRGGGYLQQLEQAATDVCARVLRHQVVSDIVIVGIDSRSLAQLNSWPWPRRYHASVISRLRSAAAKQVFVDIDFSARSNPEDDALLEASLAGQGATTPIVLPAFFQQITSADSEIVVTQPLERLSRHAALASVNLQPGADGLVRSMPSSWKLAGRELPSVVTQLSASRRPQPVEIPIDFSISPASFAFVSYADVLAGRIAPATFSGKTILVGATAIELHDMAPVPLYRAVPGVVLQALALQTIRAGILRRLPNGLYLAVLMGGALLLSMLFGAQPWRRNLAALAAAFGLIALAAVYVYAVHRLLIEVAPLALAVAATFLIATLRSLDEQTLRAIAYALGLRKHDALLRSIVESSTDCIVCIDEHGRIQTANSAATRMFACDATALLGTPISRHIPDILVQPSPDTPASLEALAGSLSERNARTYVGDVFPVELSISRAGINGDRLYTAIVRDISERKAQQRELEYRALHDTLTSLPNRAALDAYLEDVLASAGGAGTVALLMLDLCRFKEVNDTLGHQVGDRVLHEVAQRFVRTLDEAGFVARVGGDEFAVVLTTCAEKSVAVGISQNLADSLREPIELGGVAIDVGVSTGIAYYPEDAQDGSTLLKHADVAMYVAKKSGSAYERYDAAYDGYSVRKLTMVSELRGAIASGGVSLHYQPVIDLKTHRVAGVEALLRWQHPTLGPVSPTEFMAIAESTDLIRPLTEVTLSEALAQIPRWERAGLALRVAVNLSARMLHDTDFPARLASLLAACNVSPASLEIEITESAMMLDPARALRIIREIHELDVLIAIDDYGTGFSSLGYLRDLPVHALKLDKSFVAGMRGHSGDRVIVESTVQMAHALELQTVAEGVETDWDVQFLTAAGCDYAQGYHYSPALPGDRCCEWIRNFNSLAPSRVASEPGRVAPVGRTSHALRVGRASRGR